MFGNDGTLENAFVVREIPNWYHLDEEEKHVRS